MDKIRKEKIRIGRKGIFSRTSRMTVSILLIAVIIGLMELRLVTESLLVIYVFCLSLLLSIIWTSRIIMEINLNEKSYYEFSLVFGLKLRKTKKCMVKKIYIKNNKVLMVDENDQVIRLFSVTKHQKSKQAIKKLMDYF